MKFFIGLITVYFPLLCMAGDGDYSVLKINKDLLKGANVVIRLQSVECEIIDEGKLIQKEHYVYTILNEQGRRFAYYASGYDKFISIKVLTGTLYDALGNEIRRMKTKDFEDESNVSGISLMEDNRVKTGAFYHTSYPYTVEFEETKIVSGVLGFNGFNPIPSSNVAVEKARLFYDAPANYELRYKAYLSDIKPQISQNGDRKHYLWEQKDIAAISWEPLRPPFSEIIPNVVVAPSLFEVSGYRGNMSNWKDYGLFMNNLIKGRDLLPDNVKQEVFAIIQNIKTDREKIFALYRYMQKNTRYISVQLGIGGWQPFDANYVATKKYGDCKALSNYMIALLKEAGIKAKYVEIYAGKENIPYRADFTYMQGNHVICCVPMGKDTIWLECTSQTTMPGYMGGFTGNRNAFLIDENGGFIVRTPKYSYKDNLQIRKINANAGEDGLLDMSVTTNYQAIKQDGLALTLERADDKRVKEILNEQFDLPQYDLLNYKHTINHEGSFPVIHEDLNLKISNYFQISGKRLFIVPNVLTRSKERLNPVETRRYPVELSEEYTDIDTVEIKVPAGYLPEAMPAVVSLNTKFGKYNSSARVEGDKIIYYRTIERYGGRFPAADYNELVKFFDQIYKADRTKVVLVKKEG